MTTTVVHLSSFLSFFLSCLLLLLQTTRSDDPCKEATYIGHEMRRPSHVTNFDDMELCDSELDPASWYTFGGEITDSCVPLSRCGTYSGIWFDGIHPKDDDVVFGRVCSTDAAGDCCGWNSSISIKRCPDGYVYKLAIPTTCPMSYCVGETVKCLSGEVYYKQSGTCLKVPLIHRPKLGEPYVSEEQQILLFTATAFSIDCMVDTIESGKTLHSQGKLKISVTFRMNDDVVAKFFVDHPTPRIPLSESYLVGHLGKTLTCEVQFYYAFDDGTFSTKSREMKSPGYFLGVVAVDIDGVAVKELKVSQGVPITISLKASFPITTRHCLNQEKCTVPKYTFYVGSSKKEVKHRSCQFSFGNSLGAITYISWPPIQISSQVTAGTEYSKNFLIFKPFDHVFSKTLFQGYTIAPIQISVEETKTRPTCHSIGDPHFSSFSNIKFDNYFTGDFNLLSTPTEKRTFQIQVRQIPCGKAGVTCNCGLIAREGNNIVGINACDYRRTPLIFELMKDNVNPTASIEKIGNSYSIFFVSGVKVDINPFEFEDATFMHIYVHGLKYETYNGVCAVTEAPNDFNVFRIEYADSFFKNRLPPCVDEVFEFPTCHCDSNYAGGTNKNLLVDCEFSTPDSNLQVIKMNKICDVNRRRRRKREAANERVELVSNSGFESESGFTLDDIFKNVNHTIDNDRTPVVESIGEDTARVMCERVFHKSPLYSKCWEYLKSDAESLKANCVDDVKFSGIEELANVYLNTYEYNCKIKLEKSIELINGTESPKSVAILADLQEIQAATCATCRNGGECLNGTCLCTEGFSGTDCSYEMNKPPVIGFIQKSRYCDMTRRLCHLILLELSVVEGKLECNVKVTLQDGSYKNFTGYGLSILPGTFQCPLDVEALRTNGRKRRSRVDLSLFVTNKDGGNDLRSNELHMTIFDGSCLSCIDGECLQRNSTCLIDGVCYESMYKLDDYHHCNPALSMTEWTESEW